MSDKRSFGARLYEVAENYNLNQSDVNRIVNEYITECRQDLFDGKEVRILGLVILVPNPMYSECGATLALYAKKIATKTGCPFHTVRGVVGEYIDILRNELYEGRNIDIRGLVSMHPLMRNGEIVKVHSILSTSIKGDLPYKSQYVTSVRAHTCKLLKHNMFISKLHKKGVSQ